MSGPADPVDGRDGTRVEPDSGADGHRPPIVDWGRTGRRMRTSIAVITAAVVAGWLVIGALDGGLRGRLLGELIGVGVLTAFVAEFVIVGGAALRGMLRAGERGDRLSGNDVSLLPPQIRRRR